MLPVKENGIACAQFCQMTRCSFFLVLITIVQSVFAIKHPHTLWPNDVAITDNWSLTAISISFLISSFLCSSLKITRSSGFIVIQLCDYFLKCIGGGVMSSWFCSTLCMAFSNFSFVIPQITMTCWANVGPMCAATLAQCWVPMLGQRDFAHRPYVGATLALDVGWQHRPNVGPTLSLAHWPTFWHWYIGPIAKYNNQPT